MPVVEQGAQNKLSQFTKKITLCKKKIKSTKNRSWYAISFDRCQLELTEFKIKD